MIWKWNVTSLVREIIYQHFDIESTISINRKCFIFKKERISLRRFETHWNWAYFKCTLAFFWKKSNIFWLSLTKISDCSSSGASLSVSESSSAGSSVTSGKSASPKCDHGRAKGDASSWNSALSVRPSTARTFVPPPNQTLTQSDQLPQDTLKLTVYKWVHGV